MDFFFFTEQQKIQLNKINISYSLSSPTTKRQVKRTHGEIPRDFTGRHFRTTVLHGLQRRDVCILLLRRHEPASDFSHLPDAEAQFFTCSRAYFYSSLLHNTNSMTRTRRSRPSRGLAGSEVPLNLSILGVITEERQQCGPALHTKAPCSLLFYTWPSRKLPPSLTHHLRVAVLTKLLNESLLRGSRPLSQTFTFSTTEVLLWLTFRNPQSLDALKSRNTHNHAGKYQLQFGTGGLRPVIPWSDR